MSERRLAGVLLVGLAILAVVAGSSLAPRSLIGSPVPVLVPGPPVVGDCVLYSGLLPWNPLDVTPDVAVAGTGSYSYPRLRISRCSGARYGEVVAVIPTPVRPVITYSVDGGTTVIDPNLDGCQAAAWRYIGLGTAPMFTLWRPAAMTGTAASMPSVLQQAAGQHWLACITFPVHGPAARGGILGPPGPYEVPLRGALLTGADRDQLGSCLSGMTFSPAISPAALTLIEGSCSATRQPVVNRSAEPDCRRVARKSSAGSPGCPISPPGAPCP